MVVAIGTKNKAKVRALEEVLQSYEDFKELKIFSIAVSSDVSDQPLSLKETIQGAKNRAIQAFERCERAPLYGFGIESGLIEAPGTRNGFFNVCVCCIYNGVDCRVGLSSAFEIPDEILKLMMEQKLNLSEACLSSGISQNENIGQEEGLIGILTKGRVTRMDYTKESIHSALLQLTNQDLYKMQKHCEVESFS